MSGPDLTHIIEAARRRNERLRRDRIRAEGREHRATLLLLAVMFGCAMITAHWHGAWWVCALVLAWCWISWHLAHKDACEVREQLAAQRPYTLGE